MEPVKRPLGVAILSVVAFIASPVLIVLFLFFCFNTYERNELPSSSKDPAAFIWLALWLLVLLIAFLLLSWLSYTAGRELWDLKERGRRLATFTMPLFLFVGGISTAGGDRPAIVVGTSICALSIFFFVYLQMPSIRRRFEAPAAKPAE